MKGLLLKEYYTLKPYAKTYMLYILLFGGITVATGQVTFFATMAGMIVFSLPVSSFSLDDQCRWDVMALSTPLSRRNIVMGKYLLCIIFAGGAAVVQLVLSPLCILVNPMLDIVELFVSGFSAVVVILLAMMLLLPLTFKFGAEKIRVIMMICLGSVLSLIILFVLIAMPIKAGGELNLPEWTVWAVLAAELAALALGYVVSYRISCSIYSKKDI